MREMLVPTRMLRESSGLRHWTLSLVRFARLAWRLALVTYTDRVVEIDGSLFEGRVHAAGHGTHDVLRVGALLLLAEGEQRCPGQKDERK